MDADEAAYFRAVLKGDEGRDEFDLKLRRQFPLFVYVYLADLDLGLFFGDFIDDGRKHLARPAPGGPEIDEDDAAAQKSTRTTPWAERISC